MIFDFTPPPCVCLFRNTSVFLFDFKSYILLCSILRQTRRKRFANLPTGHLRETISQEILPIIFNCLYDENQLNLGVSSPNPLALFEHKTPARLIHQSG